ncbi:MAG: Hpt domain-containing protein [Panacagrimonas sp.]
MNSAPADFNPEVWADLRSLFEHAGVVELVGVLEADLQQQEHVVRAGDPMSLRRVAHALRGAAQQLGADALAQLWTQVEQASCNGQIDESRHLSESAIARHAALVAHLRRETGDA